MGGRFWTYLCQATPNTLVPRIHVRCVLEFSSDADFSSTCATFPALKPPVERRQADKGGIMYMNREVYIHTHIFVYTDGEADMANVMPEL